MLHVNSVIVVEGKYDKEKLKKVVDAPIICTYGFSVYKNKRIVESIKKLAENTDNRVIVLTDSDSAGFRIRNYIKQCLGEKFDIRQAYIPKIEGKEKRKDKAGKEGILGVEGMTEEVLCDVLKKTLDGINKKEEELKKLTKAEFYEDGFLGKGESALKREKLLKLMGLPKMSANALFDIINKAYGYDEYKRYVEKIK